MPGWSGEACLLNGDSRELAKVLGFANASVSSPPYSEARIGSESGQEHCGRGDQYSAAISSPPFTDSEGQQTAGKFKDPEEFARIRSENYKNGKTKGHYASPEAILRSINKNDNTGYASTPGQLGAMKANGFEAAVMTSYDTYKHGIITGKENKPCLPVKYAEKKSHEEADGVLSVQITEKQKLSKASRSQKALERKYPPQDATTQCQTVGEINTLTGKAETKSGEALPGLKRAERFSKETDTNALSVDHLNKSKFTTSLAKNLREESGTTTPQISKRFVQVVTSRNTENRSMTQSAQSAESTVSPEITGHIAPQNVDELEILPPNGDITLNDDDFWGAASQIVGQVYQVLVPGGHAVWVVKSFVKNKERVDFPGQWRQLCEVAGFVTLHEHHALLVHSTEHDFDGKEKRRESKSFFRRLAENKGSPRIDYEVVYCMEKPG
jgi:hypothetical protein